MTSLLSAAGFEFRSGRAHGAPELEEGAATLRIAAVHRVGMIFLGMGSLRQCCGYSTPSAGAALSRRRNTEGSHDIYGGTELIPTRSP